MTSVTSPDGALIADWYQISGGGAASATSDSVAIRRANEPFQETSEYVFGTVDADRISMKWQSARELEITYMEGTTVGRQRTQWNDVEIHYRLVRRTP